MKIRWKWPTQPIKFSLLQSLSIIHPFGWGFVLMLALLLSLSAIKVAASPKQKTGHYPDITSQITTTPYLVRDINPVTNSLPSDLVAVGNKLFFRADDNSHGEELWLSDGTFTGTVIVRDINGYASDSNVSHLVALNDILLFRASDGIYGTELWRSDGTYTGTVMVKDIYPGYLDSYPLELAEWNGLVYFSANDGYSGDGHGVELWRTDGTFTGTEMVKELADGPFGSSPKYFTEMSGTLYFQATDGWVGNKHGTELWRTDGTYTGTSMVRDINPGITSSLPFYLEAVDDLLFFQADDGVHGKELWKSDGTFTGTVLVKDIYTGTEDSSPGGMLNWNGTLFFRADDGVHGTELWRSDGTPTGTVMVKDINPGIQYSNPYEFTIVSETLLFRAADGWTGDAHGGELWKTDGTLSGTVMIKDISPSPSMYPYKLTNVDDTLFFMANNGTHGYELWRSDGTFTGTVMVADIYSGTNGSWPTDFTSAGNSLFFQADDGIHQKELWALTIKEPDSKLIYLPIIIRED